jgi:hypothetical protein
MTGHYLVMFVAHYAIFKDEIVRVPPFQIMDLVVCSQTLLFEKRVHVGSSTIN